MRSKETKEFTSEIFKSLTDELKIQKTYTPSYNPRSNGKLERWHRDLNAFMRAASAREDPTWITYLPALTLVHNTKEHSATGVTPSLAFLGRELRLPVDLLVGLPHQDHRSVHEHVRNTLDKYKETRGSVLVFITKEDTREEFENDKTMDWTIGSGGVDSTSSG